MARAYRFVMAAVVAMLVAIAAHPFEQDACSQATADPRLAEYLKRFPEADADRDGVLSMDEAVAHRAKKRAGKSKAADAGSSKAGKAKQSQTDSASATATPSPPPTIADARYGRHERNVLDFYRAESDRPTPVVVFFHGGGFRGGDKRSFAARVPPYLAAGISVVSANYRYSSQAIYPGPQLDGARAVQFVRSMASQWNIDPDRVVLSGSSAGGQIGMWLALGDDLADPASSDPISLYSTRGSAFIGYVTPCSIEPEFVQKHMGVTDFGAVLPLFGVSTLAELSSAEKRDLVRDASPICHLSSDDPPLLLIYGGELTPTPLPADTPFGGWIHHPHFGVLMQEACEPLGIDCRVFHAGSRAPAAAEVAFLTEVFEAQKPPSSDP